VQNSLSPLPWLQFVHNFFGRQIAWPPANIASAYFGRSWHVEEFSHDPNIRANYYPTVLLHHVPQPPDGQPQVFHFAYKHPSLFNARWLQYGLVRIQSASATLHHISGYTDQLQLEASNEPVPVETWFGPGPALFRIASLHPFSHCVADASDATSRALRFPG
jgi:hypothetical protein